MPVDLVLTTVLGRTDKWSVQNKVMIVMKLETFLSIKFSHKWSQETHLRCMLIPAVNINVPHMTTCDQIARDGC